MVLAPAAAWGRPNDAGWGVQWGFERIGAESAWSNSKGSGAVIALIDTGVDLIHEDLKPNIASGSKQDTVGHGTLLAGVAAAVANNIVGIAGVAPAAKILAPGALSKSSTPADVAAAIDSTIGKAQVINLGFDWLPHDGFAQSVPDFWKDQGLRDAVRRAAESGATVVIAAGNDRGQVPYTDDVPGVVVVGATGQQDQPGESSNQGPGLDLVAPGEQIMSTYWQKDKSTPCTRDGKATKMSCIYGVADGTGLSAAFVSGTAALLMSSGISNVDAVNRMLETAQDMGLAGRDDMTGYGMVDAARAFDAPRIVQPTPSPSPSESQPGPTPETTNVGSSFGPSGAGTPTSPGTPSSKPSASGKTTSRRPAARSGATARAVQQPSAPAAPSSTSPDASSWVGTVPTAPSDSPSLSLGGRDREALELEGPGTYLAAGLNMLRGAAGFGRAVQPGHVAAALALLMAGAHVTRLVARRRVVR